jgi:hypothetical protein
MTTTRAALIAYLAAEHARLLIEARMETGDSAAGLKYPADQAFRRLGVAEENLASATSANAAALFALGDYYTLRRIARAIAARVDFGSPGVEGDRPRVFQHIQGSQGRGGLRGLIADAAGDCAAQGYPVGDDAASQQWSYSGLNLDMIEPEWPGGQL